MRPHALASLAATLATTLLASGLAMAQAAKPADDHSAHHPPAAASAPATSRAGTAPAPEGYERQMKAMQDMHQKMQAARTPADRAKQMDEHMKLMQSGMAMMGQMRGGEANAPGSAGAGMPGMMGMHMQMERRIAMMEQMMQMLVDREAARTGR